MVTLENSLSLHIQMSSANQVYEYYVNFLYIFRSPSAFIWHWSWWCPYFTLYNKWLFRESLWPELLYYIIFHEWKLHYSRSEML